MARYKLILAYDGTEFLGSQRQAHARTVQGELENALKQLGWRGSTVIMAGRTDTGTHASGQVAAFDMEWTGSTSRLLHALNAKLPYDMAVRDLQETSDKFHPRFDATSRKYVYRLFCEPIRNPLREKLAWRIWPSVDAAALEKAARLFRGTHDFAAFGSPTTSKGTTQRTVTKAEWKSLPDGECQFEIQADAFLYRMVRRMVFVQAAVGLGRCSVEEIRNALNGRGKLPSGLAPAHGLTLVEVTYGIN